MTKRKKTYSRKSSRAKTEAKTPPSSRPKKTSEQNIVSKKSGLSFFVGKTNYIVVILTPALIAIFLFAKDLLSDDRKKEKIEEVAHLNNDLNNDTVYCKLLMIDDTEYTNEVGWIRNDFNVYETIFTTHTMYDFPLNFTRSDMSKLVVPNVFTTIIDLNSVEIDSIRSKDKMLYTFLPKNPIINTSNIEDHNAHSHVNVAFSKIYFKEPIFFKSDYLKYTTSPYIPDSIKEPLHNLLLMKFRLISVGKVIERLYGRLPIVNDGVTVSNVNRSVIILSNDGTTLFDTITSVTPLYEPYNEFTGENFDFGYIHKNHYSLAQKITRFLYYYNIRF